MNKIKTQIQEQLEQEIVNHKGHQDLLQAKTASLEGDIREYQGQLKEKMGEIRELRLQGETLRKEQKQMEKQH